MTEIDLVLPDRVAPEVVEQAVDACCTTEGLTITMKSTLTTYPGSIHWHFKKGKEKGTLEATFWPKTQRFWFAVHARRNGPWIDESIVRLKDAMQAMLEVC